MKKTVPTESFFNFFDPPKAPEADEDDAASDVEERLELDYQLGEDIKEKLIPRAIDWFTGEALQFEEVDDDLEEGDFEDEDDEEDDDVSEDRDDEEESDEEVRRQMYLLCTTQADPDLRMTAQNPSRRLLNASRARFRRLSFGVKGRKARVIIVISSPVSRQPGSIVDLEDSKRILTLRSSCTHTI